MQKNDIKFPIICHQWLVQDLANVDLQSFYSRGTPWGNFYPLSAAVEKLLTLQGFSAKTDWNQAADHSSTPIASIAVSTHSCTR